MTEPIAVPVAAARRIEEIIRRRGALEVELQQAVALVLATLGAPDGSQLRIEPDGSMVAVDLRQAQAPAPVGELVELAAE